MAGLNKVMIIGNLGADVELKYTAGNQPVASFRLATSDNWTDKEGQRQERTEWHRIVVFGRLAELCSKYLSKGRQVYVEGRLQTRQWQDKDGNTRYTTEINARDILFLNNGSRTGNDDYVPMDRGYDGPRSNNNGNQYGNQYNGNQYNSRQYNNDSQYGQADMGGGPDFSQVEEDGYPF